MVNYFQMCPIARSLCNASIFTFSSATLCDDLNSLIAVSVGM